MGYLFKKLISFLWRGRCIAGLGGGVRVAGLDDLVTQLVLIILKKGLKLDLGDADEGLPGGDGGAEPELGVAIKHLVGEAVHLGILVLLLSDAAVEEDDLGGEFLALPLRGLGVVCQLGVALLPLGQGFGEVSDHEIVVRELGLEVVDCLIGGLLLGGRFFGEDVELSLQILHLLLGIGLGGLGDGELRIGVTELDHAVADHLAHLLLGGVDFLGGVERDRRERKQGKQYEERWE